MEKVRTGLKNKWTNWISGFGLRTDKISLIIGVLFAAGYLGLAAASVYFSGISQISLIIIAALAVLGLFIYFVKIPVYGVIRFLVAIAIPAAAFFLIECYTHELDTLVDSAIRLNLILYYLIWVLLFFVTGRVWLSCTVLTAFIFLCGVANYFVMLFRSAPIVPWDFYSLGTAMNVADNYTFSIEHEFAVISCMFLTLILISLRLGLHLKYRVVRGAFAAVIAVVFGFFLNYLWDPDTPKKEGLNKSLFVASTMYKKDGFLLAFTLNLRYLNVDEPENYDRQEAIEILASQEVEEVEVLEELPNVIVIMSETFSDPAVLGEFETNKDYMPFIRDLMENGENVVSGQLYVSVLGGGTANSEYEFLTGNSMKFFPLGSVVYQQYLNDEISSMVNQFNELGYQTTAMHPYKANGWKRTQVYPLMEFDKMLFSNDLSFRTRLRTYISDESNYLNLMSEINKTEEPLFLHNVTMQNHSAYGGTYDNFDPQITANFKKTKSNKYLNNYLSLMYETDMATESLIKKLELLDEPTIVCFYGDHQPNDYVVKPIYKEHGLDIENQDLEQLQKRQITPFFIWANFDIEEQRDVKISTNYLGNLLLKTAGFELNEYRTFLETVAETFPVMNPVGYFDAEGNCKAWEDITPEEKEVLDTYEKVQYYQVFD